MVTARPASQLRLRIAGLTVLLLLLAACARGAEPPGVEAPAPGHSAPPAEQSAPTGEPAPGEGPAPAEEVAWRVPPLLADLGIRDATGDVVHRQFDPDEIVDRPGIYFLDTTTGKLDHWSLADGRFAQYNVTGDNRWIQAWDSQELFLIDRQEGTAVAWPIDRQVGLAAMADHALLAGQERYILTSKGLLEAAPLEAVRPPEDPAARQAALFSKDGRFLALLTDHTLHVMETGTGELTARVQVLPGGSGHAAGYVSLEYSNLDDEFVVSVFSQGEGEPGGRTDYRYAWTGELRGESTAPEVGALSPDRSLAASWTDLAGILPAVVISDVASGEPLFRVRGVTLCDFDLGVMDQPWLSDSSGLVVRTGAGHRILTREGALVDTPAFAGHSGLFREPQPAPDRPDLFAIGRTKVVDGTGKVLAEAKLAENPGHLPPWGFTSRELRFVLPHWGHGGRCGDLSDLGGEPVLERPPFRDEVLLQPDLPEGDCVNLRATPGLAAETVTCVPGGTLLTVVEREGDRAGLEYADGDTWILVRTEAGETGWAPLKAGNLKWAR